MLCRYELTYRLSISECMSSHSRKWRKEQPYILNPTFVLEGYPNMKVTYNLSTSECMIHTAVSGENRNHIFVITNNVLECYADMK